MQLSKILHVFKRFGSSPKAQLKMQQEIDAKATALQHAEVILSVARKKMVEVDLAEQAEYHLSKVQVQVEALRPLEARLDGKIERANTAVTRAFIRAGLLCFLSFATIAMGQNTDTVTAQKACYEQATLVESKSTSGQIVDREMYGTQWTNHYDLKHETCWVLEVWFDTAHRDVFKTGLGIRVFDAFVAHAYPDGEFVGKSDGNTIDISRDICVVHNVRCSNSNDFGKLITNRYGFPDGVTFGMTAEAQMLAEGSERKFKEHEAAKAKK